MDEVFDEELMKELGLEPEELKEGKAAQKPKAEQGAQAKPSPKTPGAKPKPGSPTPQAPKAPKPAQKPAEKPAPKQAKPFIQSPATTGQQKKMPSQPVSPESQAKKMSHEIPVQIAAVLAKKTVRLSDVLAMNVGEVLDFKKIYNEPIDLVANGKLVAKAELVMVEGKLGVRIIKLVR